MNARMFRAFVKTAMELQADNDTPGDYVLAKAAAMAKFPKLAAGVLNAAVHPGYANHLELAGLGVLAAPAVANMAGHPMDEKWKDRAEVAGLGILAAPYAHNLIAARNARYANSGFGRKLTQIFAH